ncbi:MAG: ATP-binding protein [Chloroflexi bacterium]|nr:ATP-binding protein [Chloroflexota bacterium]
MSEQELAREAVGELPEPVSRPVLVVVSGLPGSGKSYFSRKLAEKLPSAIVESDILRLALFSTPTHSQAESRRVFLVCHLLIRDLLKRGVRVILDATNLEEGQREQLYHIAESLGTKLILVWVEAPEEIIKERLERRHEAPEPQDHSDAGWEIYKRMRPRAEPIGRNHFVVDTSRDISPVIEKVWRKAQR